MITLAETASYIMNYELLKQLHTANFPNARNHFHPTKGKIPPATPILFSPCDNGPHQRRFASNWGKITFLPPPPSLSSSFFSRLHPLSLENLLFIVVMVKKGREGVLWIYPPTWRTDTFNILKCLHWKYVHCTGNWHYKIPSLFFSFRFTQFQDSLFKENSTNIF